jgi:hypothetical protein
MRGLSRETIERIFTPGSIPTAGTIWPLIVTTRLHSKVADEEDDRPWMFPSLAQATNQRATLWLRNTKTALCNEMVA